MTVASGDVNALAAMLAQNAKVVSDGGGVVKAARKVVEGRINAAKLIVGVLRHGRPTSVEVREINGWPSLVWRREGELGVLSIETDGREITAIHLVNNPEKLGALRA
jgi:RNA polymerase sigma-70 factor (ECF subfamily)